MNFFKKIQKFDNSFKKLVVFTVIFILAIPLAFFIGKNFQKRLNEFEEKEFLKELNIQELKEKNKEFQEEFKKIEELKNQITTSTLLWQRNKTKK